MAAVAQGARDLGEALRGHRAVAEERSKANDAFVPDGCRFHRGAISHDDDERQYCCLREVNVARPRAGIRDVLSSAQSDALQVRHDERVIGKGQRSQ